MKIISRSKVVNRAKPLILKKKIWIKKIWIAILQEFSGLRQKTISQFFEVYWEQSRQ